MTRSTTLPLLDAACCVPLVREPLTAAAATDLARTLKAIADPARLRLLSMIASQQGGEICVCDLTPAFELSQPTISHHLKLLKQAGLIASERRGTWVYYRLLPQQTDKLAAILTRPGNPDVQPLQPLDEPAGAAS